MLAFHGNPHSHPTSLLPSPPSVASLPCLLPVHWYPTPPPLSFTCIEFDVVLSLSLSHFILFYVYCAKKKRKMKPKRDWAADWISNNDDTVRGFPIFVGGASLLAVLVNRAVTGIAPVADASR